MSSASRPFVLTASVLASCALAACSSTRGEGLGSVPRDLVELYDLARPGGVIEIELDRDGTVREMEAEIAVEAVPASIRDAVAKSHPGARIVGAERELTAEGRGYEVQVQDGGRDLELVFDERGELIELERSLSRGEAPAAVMQAAERAVPGGTFRSVEIVEQRGQPSYHVKLEKGGASYKVILSPDGKVERKVREQRAEIEVPLE